MGVNLVFRCEHCAARPDRATRRTLERRLRDLAVGRCFDAQPGNWLVWSAGGPFGSKRYACPDHRAELLSYLRRHYGGSRSGLHEAEPFEALWPSGFSGLGEREVAELLAPAARRRDSPGVRAR